MSQQTLYRPIKSWLLTLAPHSLLKNFSASNQLGREQQASFYCRKQHIAPRDPITFRLVESCGHGDIYVIKIAKFAHGPTHTSLRRSNDSQPTLEIIYCYRQGEARARILSTFYAKRESILLGRFTQWLPCEKFEPSHQINVIFRTLNRCARVAKSPSTTKAYPHTDRHPHISTSNF